jgi:hypothetical protein
MSNNGFKVFDLVEENTKNIVLTELPRSITEINQQNLTADSVSGENPNTIIGSLCFNNTSGGIQNTVLGYDSLSANTIGQNNTAIGAFVLNSNTAGSNNIGIGNNSLTFGTNNNDNIGIGLNSLSNITGSQNIKIGNRTGNEVFRGNNNILIGYGSSTSSSLNPVSNEITLGNSDIITLRCAVNAISSLSDSRDKSDINKLEVGLDFVEKLNPVTFKWDRRDKYENGVRDGSKKQHTVNTGFLAQDLKKLQDDNNLHYLDLVYESNPDKLEAKYGNLIPVLVKAIKDLSLEVKELKSKLA